MKQEKLDRIADNLMSLVHLTNMFKFRHEEAGLKPSPFDPHLGTLMMLMHCGGLPISKIGGRLHRSKPNMTAIIDRLISERRVVRAADKQDRRIINISITNQGKKFVLEQRKRIKAHLKTRLAALSSSEINLLGVSLENTYKILAKTAKVMRVQKCQM